MPKTKSNIFGTFQVHKLAHCMLHKNNSHNTCKTS